MKQSKPLLCLLSLALCLSPALAFATVNEGADTEALLEVADDMQDLDGASDAVELDIVDEAGEVGQSTIVEEETKTDSPVPLDEESDVMQINADEEANGLAEKPAAPTEGAIADSAVNDEAQNDALSSDNAALADAGRSDSSDLPESWKDPNPPAVKSLGGLNGVVFSVGDTIKVEGAAIDDPDGVNLGSVYYNFVSAPDAEGSCGAFWVDADYGRRVGSDFRPGSYRLDYIDLTDERGYKWVIVPEGDDREWGFGVEVIHMALPEMSLLLGDKEKENFYKPLEGNNSTYEKGSDVPLSVRFDGALEDFVLATVDGRHLPESNYGLKSGSTIITLSSAYLNSLAPGTHQLVAWFNDGGNGIATFTVEGDDKDSVTDVPVGSDNNSVATPNGNNTPKADLAQTGDKAKKPALAQTGDDASTALPAFFAIASLICFVVARSRIRMNAR